MGDKSNGAGFRPTLVLAKYPKYRQPYVHSRVGAVEHAWTLRPNRRAHDSLRDRKSRRVWSDFLRTVGGHKAVGELCHHDCGPPLE